MQLYWIKQLDLNSNSNGIYASDSKVYMDEEGIMECGI